MNLNEYNVLKQIDEEGRIPAGKKCLSKYIEEGLLQRRKAIEIKHPWSDDVEYCAMNKVRELILQVTQQCNLRCSYCSYSGNYYNREHSDRRMPFDMAKKAIDFYFDHTGDTDELSIAFYGGEPLLEFPLIQKCVAYSEERVKDKNLKFYITTNGTLLTDKEISFFVEHNFVLTISLDGKKEEHDINRKFRNGKGSFDLIIQNLQRMKSYNESYFSTVMYNTVINPKADLKSVLDYFSKSQIFPPRQVNMNMLANTGLKNDSLLTADDSFWIPNRYEYMKVLLYMIDKIKLEDLHPLYISKEIPIENLYKDLRRRSAETSAMHHGGPCIAGTRRLFVNTTGDLYPCERVSESVQEMQIGTVDKDFNYEKMRAILNIGSLTEGECLDCWNLRLCSTCAGAIDPIDGRLTKEKKLLGCTHSCEKTLHDLRELCTLVENGYRFREEKNNE